MPSPIRDPIRARGRGAKVAEKHLHVQQGLLPTNSMMLWCRVDVGAKTFKDGGVMLLVVVAEDFGPMFTKKKGNFMWIGVGGAIRRFDGLKV